MKEENIQQKESHFRRNDKIPVEAGSELFPLAFAKLQRSKGAQAGIYTLLL